MSSEEKLLEELQAAMERIRFLESQVRFKNQLLKDSKEMLQICADVVSHKSSLLTQASDILERVLETGEYDGLNDILKKIK